MRLSLLVGMLASVVALGSFAPAVHAEDKDPKPPAAAPASVAAEVIVLLATNDNSGIDPKIGKMPQLGKPPFSAYNSYKLLDREKLSLAKGQPTTTKLPGGSDLMVTMKDEIAGKAGEPKKYVVSASIRKGQGASFLPLLEVNAKPGDIFFVAGQKHEGGVLVIGINILP